MWSELAQTCCAGFEHVNVNPLPPKVGLQVFADTLQCYCWAGEGMDDSVVELWFNMCKEKGVIS